MKKKFLALLLATLMVVSLLPATAFATRQTPNVVSLDSAIENGYILVSELDEEGSTKVFEDELVTHIVTEGGIELVSGTSIKIGAVSKYGYKLDNITVTVDGESPLVYTTCCSFIMPEKDIKISASFSENNNPVVLSDHTKMLLGVLADFTGETPKEAIESVEYYLSDLANTAFMVSSDLLNGTYTIDDDPYKLSKILLYTSFLSVNAALNKIWTEPVTSIGPQIDMMKCIINEAGPLGYRIMDLFYAYTLKDWTSYATLYQEVNEDRLALCDKCFKEDPVGPEVRSDISECFYSMLAYLTNNTVNGNVFDNKKEAYEAYAKDLCMILGTTNSAVTAKYAQYADEWVEDEDNHFILNHYSSLLPKSSLDSMSDDKLYEYVNKTFVCTILSCFDTFVNNHFTDYSDYYSDFNKNRFTDGLCETLDHLMGLRESILSVLDTVRAYSGSVAFKDTFDRDDAIAFYCGCDEVLGLYGFNGAFVERISDVQSDWDNLFEACSGNTVTTSAFSVTDIDGIKTIRLFRNINCADCSDVITGTHHHGDEAIVVPSGSAIVLDLNGYTLNAKGTFDANKRVFEVNGKLTIEDSSDSRKNGSGTGKITGGFVLDDGGAIVVEKGGELVINSGAICDNKAANINEDGQGGGAIDCSGKLTINGGALYHNMARWGGAIGLNKGSEFLMTGGRIFENEALTMNGGAINMYAGKSGKSFNTGEHITSTIIGGEIYGNISARSNDEVDKDTTENGIPSEGCAVWVEGTLYLGGNVKIYGNKQGDYDNGWSNLTPGGNLAIVNNNDVGARGLLKISSDHPLQNGANIWLSQTSEHVKVVPFTEGTELTDYDITTANGFTSANVKYLHVDTANVSEGYTIVENSGVFSIKKPEAKPSSGGGSSSSTVTVPVSGAENSVKVSASVSGSTATVKKINDADLEKVTEGESVTIDLSGAGKNINTAKIPTNTIEKISEKSALTIKLPLAAVEFDAEATKEIVIQAEGSNIELVIDNIKEASLNAVQKEAVKKLDTAIIIDIHLASNGEKICTEDLYGFNGGKAKVILPYEIKNNRTAENYSVFYVSEEGRLEKLNAEYDEELEAFVFEIEHLSNYALAYDDYLMPFVDVPTDEYYDAIKWAAKNAVTDGVDPVHFNPTGITNRAQMVTFLWKLAGRPEPTITECPFTDVKEGSYYYDAVLWAYENGVTDGTSETTFEPEKNMSRAEAVTFLWKYEGQPYVDYYMEMTDVDEEAYYAEAVRWALAEKITKGTGETTFSPDGDCLRNQIVTFLYRAFFNRTFVE